MKLHFHRIKAFILCFLFFNVSFTHAQVKGLYVDFFGSYILHDATLKSNLIDYANANGFNYLLLYDVQSYVLDYTLYTTSALTADQILLRDFIATAKSTISGLKIGVTGGALKPNQTQNQFFNNVVWFNNLVASNQKIDVMHLEYEYWSGGVTEYNHYITQLGHMWNDLKNGSSTLFVETYLGKINTIATVPEATQVSDIDPITDRILLHCYMPNQFMQNRLQSPGYVNMQFEYDWGSGKRYEFFKGNSKATHIIPIFSAEACDISLSSQNYYGDYLWFHGILTNGVTCPVNTANLLGYPFLDLTYENNINQPIVDFDYSYDNNIDPYDEAGNAGRGYPCADPVPTMTTCTDNANVTNGNIIDGEIWFKYGLMPLKDNDKTLYLDCGSDQTLQLLDNYNIHPQEILTAIGTTIGVSLSVVQYNWYKNGDFFLTTFPSSPDYTATASGIPFVTDIYTCEMITNAYSPYVFDYRIRDDVKITSDPNVGIGFYLSFENTPASCPNFNNGTATVHPQTCGCSPSYMWSNGQTTQTITGLSPGTYTITAYAGGFGYAYGSVTIPSFNNIPNPVIFSTNPLASCDNHLTVSSNYSTYQWYRNASIVSGATSHNYNPTQGGAYTVTVGNSSGCFNTSPQYNLNMSVSAVITGANSTCGSLVYTVPSAGIGATYSWLFPSGATYLQNKYYITVTWNSAQYSGGTISCTVTNACGNSATGSIDVLGCCNTPNFTQKNNETVTANQNYCGQQININGVYTIPGGKTVTFDNCQVQFSNEARIEVQSGGTLNIKSICTNANGITRSHLYACGTGWTGIHLDGTTAILNIDDALIENASNAVYTDNGGEFHITNSDFDMNTESIAPSNANYGICTVTGNTFNCSTCNGNTGGIIHIDAIHADQLAISGNNFTNCSIGIKSSNLSYTSVYGNTFLDIDRAGVWAENDGYIEVTSNNIFTNCNVGVNASNSVATTVDGNYFSGGAVAIVTQSCMKRKIGIQNNEIVNPSWIGIAGFFNYPSLQHYVNNTISFNPNQMVYGIAVWESNLIQPGLNNVTDINGNHIFDAAVGINIGNDYKTTVTENDIHFINSNTHKVTGILAENSHYPQITGNIVRDESALKEAQFGIVVEQGGGALLCSNNVYAMAQGIVFGGNMLGTNVQVVLNTMEKCDIGFVLRNGGDIGNQGGNGIYYYNQWINNDYDSYSFGSNISNTSHFPVFISANSVPYIITTHSNDGQNGANDILSPVSSAVSQYTATCDGNIKDPTDDAKKVINDELTYSIDSDATEWIGKNAVLDALKYKDDLNSSDADIQSFEASADNDAMGELRSLKEDFSTAFADTTIAGGDSTIIEQVKVSNQQVSDLKPIETYLKTVNDIYLNTAAINKKEFTSQQTSSLQFIAQLCPYEGGPAVYTAQYLLMYKEGVFYAPNDCNSYSPMRFAHSNTPASRFIAFPNPTDSRITFSYVLNDNDVAYFVRVLDNVGRVLMFEKLNSKSTSSTFDMSNFAPGFYQYEIFQNTNQISTGKLSIVR